MFEQVLIMQGETTFSSLLGLKGFNIFQPKTHLIMKNCLFICFCMFVYVLVCSLSDGSRVGGDTCPSSEA